MARLSTGPRRSLLSVAALGIYLLCGLATVALPGCSGCQEDPAARAKREAEEELARQKKLEEEKKKKKEEPKQEFTVGPLLAQPNENLALGGAVKPGHWVGVSQLMRANKADFSGDAIWQTTDSQGNPILVPRQPNPFSLAASRPVSLAHKQQTSKQIETTLFVPPGRETVHVRGRLASSALGLQWPLPDGLYQPMAPHEYHLVVLSSNPRRYAFLRNLDSVGPPHGQGSPNRGRYYQVLMPPADKPVPLSAQSLAWTSIAYLVWDDMSASRLSEGQQQALLEWLHWGGQLIVSGPDTLDTLRSSFLAPYLPVEPAGTMRLATQDLASLSAAWTLPAPRGPGRQIQAVNGWSAVKLKPRTGMPGLRVLAVSTADLPLVVEGRVGRGRVVVTGFRLTEPELINSGSWPSFDHFFNACLLRRPPREYSLSQEEGKLLLDWSDKSGLRLDPRRVTSLRFFGRDGGYAYYPQEVLDARRMAATAFSGGPQPALPGDDPPQPLGLGAWNDQAPVPEAARGVIRDAAGIQIPSASFVVWVLAGYLVVLVPLNWGLFRALGRIEWAWIAAPVIAVGGTALVVHLAQLDIGFVRSVTEVSVLETQPGYARGHLSRFSALYTSLSTGYDFAFEDSAGLLLPFSIGDGQRIVGESPHDLRYRRDEKVSLSGFHVLSNRADLVRSEQWIDLGGPIQWTASASQNASQGSSASVENQSKLDLRHAIAVRRSATADKWDVAWLGDVAAGATAAGPFEAVPRQELINRWDELSSVKIGNGENVLSLRRILDRAVNDEDLHPGDVRLLATVDTSLPGLNIKPRASQIRQLTVLVANLSHAPPAPPRRDSNTRRHVLGDSPRLPLDESEATPGLLP